VGDRLLRLTFRSRSARARQAVEEAEAAHLGWLGEGMHLDRRVAEDLLGEVSLPVSTLVHPAGLRGPEA
jgi:hypothetical protein